MTRRRNKQGSTRKERVVGQQRPGKGSPSSDGPETDVRGSPEEMGKRGQLLSASSEFGQTCCLLCHREKNEWSGSASHNGLLSTGEEIPVSFMPTLAQNILGEMPLWICQSCRKSVEEEERQAVPEQPLAVSLSHTSCKSQTCGVGSHSSSSSSSSSSSTPSSSSSSSCQGNSGDWDPSSFLSAHKLSGLWNSQHSTGSAGEKSNGVSASPEHVIKSARYSGLKVCTHNPSTVSTGTLPTSLNFCKSSKQFKTICHRPISPGESYHSLDLHGHSDPSAPPNSPTGLSSQPPAVPHSPSPSHLLPASGVTSHTSPSKATVCPNAGAHRSSHLTGSSSSFLKVNTPPPPLSVCNNPCDGHCTGATALQGGSSPGTTSRETTCRGHKFSNASHCLTAQTCEQDEGLGEDEDSGSDRSSCTSSTNQKDGKFCDCCYCEFFGRNTPPPAPTSRNYPEMREKLRSRLTKRKEEVPQRKPVPETQAVDHRDVDELLDFINSSEPKGVSSNKAAKRARHKLKKKEKTQQETDEQKPSDGCPNVEESDGCPNVEESDGCPNVEESDGCPNVEESDGCPNVEESELPSSGEKTLQWPQLELERVNSFLTSRLEEIKNTIKDSIRASFSVYDLNLDVNDFPKKAAVLDQKNLLSHFNGSSDLKEIDLDLTPLTLSASKGQEAKPSQDDCNYSIENSAVKRLSAVPNLSRMIWVQSQNNSESEQSSDTPGPSNDKVLPRSENQKQGQSVTGSRVKKSKKQNPQTQKCEPHNGEVLPAKTTAQGSKVQKRPLLEKTEDVSRKGPDTVNSVNSTSEKEKSEPVRSVRTDVKSSSGDKSKSRKSKNKMDKLNVSVDDVFLPKDVDSVEMDETDREVEYFKRFCLDTAKQKRQKLTINWTNFSLKKTTSNVAQ